MKLNKI